ncbi:MAG: hypothetical protein QXG35_06240 [Nitrososphaerota archaeon]
MELVSRPKSFLEELERFYLKAWRSAKRAGYYYEEIARRILEAARAEGNLMLEYASRLLKESGPLLIDLMRKDYSLRRNLECLGAKLEIKGVSKMALDVLGVLDVPSGRGVWLYAFSPEEHRALLVRVKPRDARVFARKFLFKRVIVRALKGSLAFIPALNKAYRHSLRLKFELAGDIERLPHLKPEQLPLARGGLVAPNFLVEAPVPSEGRGLHQGVGLGMLAVVKGEGLRHRAGNVVELAAGGHTFRLDSSYAPPCSAEGSIVALLLLRERSGLDGYYFGGVACRQDDANFQRYLPSNLFISMRGREIAEIVGGMPMDLVKYYEPSGGYKEGYNLFKRWLLSRARGQSLSEREVVLKFYKMMGEVAFSVPNPTIISYKELPLWVREVTSTMETA